MTALNLPTFEQSFKIACACQAFYVCVWFYTWVKPDKNTKMNEWKCHLSKCTYYFTVTICSLTLLQGYPWLPKILGGLGEDRWRSVDYRNTMSAEHLQNFTYYYYLQIFYHSLSSFTSVLPGNRTKPEMFLHHIVTMFLLVMSLRADHAPEGSVILLLHDVPDIFTSLVKGLYALDLKYETFASYCGMMIAWSYTRMYLLQRYAYSVIMYPGSNLMTACGTGLWMLFAMHCWWFYLFIGMGAKFINGGGKALPRDTSQHDIVENDDTDTNTKSKSKKNNVLNLNNDESSDGDSPRGSASRRSPRFTK